MLQISHEKIVLVDGTQHAEQFAEAVRAKPALAGLDVEWVPDELSRGVSRSRAAVVQVALDSNQVFVIDWVSAIERTQYALVDLLNDADILKIGFGFASDLDRWQPSPVWLFTARLLGTDCV